LEGKVAPILWHKYRRGDINALKLLISYNHADVEGLKYIFDASIDRLVKQQQIPPSIRIDHRFSLHPSDIHLSNGTDKQSKSIRVMPFKGNRGPAITLKDLPLRTFPIRIVGIDLTGSEQRPSGWCLLDGDTAVTKRISTDGEIVAETLKAKPVLISIDSPLSIPQGRISISDDDPGRYTYGITRYCERALKKRGVNVYPCLIRSMQDLTARGTRLAALFRKMGISVIESYPGAAQDIMNIPRKRADLALLKSGLNEFGIEGDYTTTLISHDELDAITSAIVGLFFLSGKFEALGNEEEDYLIIPDIQQNRNSWGSRRVIGLSGYIASGKTTAGRFLEQKGYAYGRFSLVLRDMLQERNIKVTRQSLQEIGEEVYENQGQRWLCKQLVERLPKEGNIVIDGLRHPEDHSFMVEKFGPDFIHIFIEAPEQVRRLRYIAEGGSEIEFESAMKHPVEGHISILATLANKTVINVSTKGEFEKAIVRVASTRTRRTKGNLCR
jgi:predicted nuclease with RNAse H fold/dephospho-CoA kinase